MSKHQLNVYHGCTVSVCGLLRRSLRNIVISEPKIDFRGSAGEFIGEFYLQWSIEFSPSDYSFQTDVLCGMTFNATYRTFTGKWLPL